jgi:hypothetical protein
MIRHKNLGGLKLESGFKIVRDAQHLRPSCGPQTLLIYFSFAFLSSNIKIIIFKKLTQQQAETVI